MTITQRIFYPLLRGMFYFFFTYLAYRPVKRHNKPAKLDGPVILCFTHGNFMCDATIAGWELPRPPKFLAKATLFFFPLRNFLEFCGVLPLIRPQDREKFAASASDKNRETFSAAAKALHNGWPICILPEGTSSEAPGIVLPLKTGIARLAFASEETYDFQLGLRIFPVSLDYGHRQDSWTGVDIRYGKVIEPRNYQELYRTDPEAAVKELMRDLTNEMVANYPHFASFEEQRAAVKMMKTGVFPGLHKASRSFAKWPEQEKASRIAQHEKLVQDFRKYRVPLEAFRELEKWQSRSFLARVLVFLGLFLGIPFAIWSGLNNALPKLVAHGAAKLFSSDKTEIMTYRMGVGMITLPPIYAAQFYVLSLLPFFSRIGFLIYAGLSLGAWWIAKEWARYLMHVWRARAGMKALSLTLGTEYSRVRTKVSA